MQSPLKIAFFPYFCIFSPFNSKRVIQTLFQRVWEDYSIQNDIVKNRFWFNVASWSSQRDFSETIFWHKLSITKWNPWNKGEIEFQGYPQRLFSSKPAVLKQTSLSRNWERLMQLIFTSVSRSNQMDLTDGPWFSCEYQNALMMVADAGDRTVGKYVR